MARGDRPLPLEQLEPYMRGAKFAVQALSRRHRDHDPDLAEDADRYFEMAERYRQAAIATFRLHRERQSRSANAWPGFGPPSAASAAR